MLSNKYLLTAIVPVSAMADKLQNFKLWVDDSPQDLKIIVIHDWRDSETGDELKAIIEGKSHIRYIEGKFGSPGAARNAALNHVDTEWTAFWDSDDLPEPYKSLELLQNQKTSTQLIVTSFRVKSAVSKNVIRESICPRGNIQARLNYLANDPGIWRIIFRTDVIRNIEFSSIKMGEDVHFLAMALDRSNPPTYYETITYTYFRDVPNQLTQDNKYTTDLYKLLKLLDSTYRQGVIESHFVTPLAVKQALSLVKYRGLKHETFEAILGIAILRRHPVFALKSTLKILLTIFCEKFSQISSKRS